MRKMQLINILFICFFVPSVLGATKNEDLQDTTTPSSIKFHPSWSPDEQRELTELLQYISQRKFYDDLHIRLMPANHLWDNSQITRIELDWKTPEKISLDIKPGLKWNFLLNNPSLYVNLANKTREAKLMLQETIATANPHVQCTDNTTALHLAAARGKVHLIRKLVHLGANTRLHIDQKPSNSHFSTYPWYKLYRRLGDTPISLAIARNGDNFNLVKSDDTIIESIKALNLKKGELTYSGPENFHPLFLTVTDFRQTNTHTVQTYIYKQLIEPEKELSQFEHNLSPLRPALMSENLEAINYLLENGANANPPCDEYYLAHIRLDSDKAPGLIETLHKYGANLDKKITDYRYHIREHVQRPLIHFWLEWVLIPNDIDKKSYEHILKSLETCLKLNIDLKATDSEGSNLLDILIEQKSDSPTPESQPLFQFLKDQGLSPNKSKD